MLVKVVGFHVGVMQCILCVRFQGECALFLFTGYGSPYRLDTVGLSKG